jgi:threonine dehydratase
MPHSVDKPQVQRLPLSAAAVRAAAARLNDHIVRTPTLASEALSRATGAQVYVKYENKQVTGAFKARGAIAKLTTLTADQAKAGVIAMSAGNHAQGVAYHAARLKIPATIVMPNGTPFMKIRKTRDYGAAVVLEGDDFTAASAAGERIAREKGLTLVHPYNDEEIIAGQGTVGLEIMEQAPGLDVLIVPVGGGGLIAGVALAAKSIDPQVEIVGVEAALYPAMINAVHGGESRCGGATLAEGIAVRDVGDKTIAIVRALVSDIVTVSETNIERAIGMFATLDKTVAEGAGAAPLAALLEHPAKFKGRRVGLLLSGGNIDSRLLSSVLMRDLVRSGQVLTLDIEMPDKPGQLHAVSGICAAQGANVLEVAHSRFAMDLSASSARLGITIETRDEDHARDVMNSIRAAGFTLTMRDPAAA